MAGLKESTAATVWQRLRDAGKLSCSITSFRRYVYREVREVDPQRVRAYGWLSRGSIP